MKAKPTVHVVSYTHWDREFRWEFELTRMKLVSCFDHLLEIMQKRRDYKSFLGDGQVGLLVDYLEIRPEQERTIRKLAAAGRLEIGPWYSLPDCATLNGESVLRNLQCGVKLSQSFGHVLRCGYNVFSFGQIAQLPQIYSHFGIDTIIFYKYMHPVRSKLPEFIWEAPDGTRAFASRLGREARWNFFFAGHIPIVYDRDPWDKAWRYDYGTLGKVFHTADPQGYGWFHEILDPETDFHPENVRKGFERTLETVRDTAAPDTLLFFDGTDFTEPHPLTPDIVKALQAQCGEEYDIRHSTLSAYLAELKERLRDRGDLQTVRGPMRDGPVGAVHSDVLTTHPEIKLVNARTENTLVRYAEPLSAMAYALGIDRYPDTYLSKAWKLLFESHPHDSIHGLGPTELAEGVVARLRQAGLVAQGLERAALGDLTKEIDTADVADATVFLAVHNTAAFSRSEVVEVWVDVPAEVALEQVVIEDADGRACRVQEIAREKTRAGLYHPRSRNMPYYCTRVHLLFWADGVPALGYRTFKVKWVAKREYPYPHEDWDAPRVVVDDLLAGPREAHNEHVALAIRPDGTFDVTDLASGRIYTGLNALLDSGDRGNMWMSDAPDQDTIIHSAGGQARIACVQHGPLSVRFRIEVALAVPARYDFVRQVRSEERVALPVVTELTLRKGSRYVEATTSLDNTARDHYLKVCFPTGLAARTTSADGSFSVTEYSTTPDLTCELARHPAQLWFDTSDGQDGLAILSRSTKDYEILDEGGRKTMAMGLVRGTRLRIPCDNRLWMEYPGDESAQSLGEAVHEYAILPHHGTWREAGLYRDALRFNQPLKACQFSRQRGRLPLAQSLVVIEDARLVLSAVKKADDRDSVLVRLFNPTDEPLQTGIHVGFDAVRAHVASMAETRVSKLALKDGRVELTVGRGQIVTVEFELKGR
jgi:mannosylglycerate hydrolase